MTRLEEIEYRLSAIRQAVADDAGQVDLDALEAEAAALTEERAALREQAERRRRLVDSIVTSEQAPVRTFVAPEETDNREERDMQSTPEYRRVFLEYLLGRPLTEEQRTYITSSTTSSGAAIPTPTANLMVEKMVKLAPMLSEITLLRVAGNVRFSAESTRDAAALHTENAAITPAGDAIITVSLTGYEFAKVLRVSKTVSSMAVDQFEGWLVDMLAGDIARAIENYIINGSGSSQPQGVVYAHASWATTYEVASTADPTADNLFSVVGLLPAGYLPNAKWLVNSRTFYTKIASLQTTANQPVVIPTLEEGVRYRLLGFPVLVSDYVADDYIYFGDYSKIVGNLGQDLRVDRSEDSGFLANAVDFRGSAIFDCKVANSDAFVRFRKES